MAEAVVVGTETTCSSALRDNQWVAHNRKELGCKREILNCGSNESGVMVKGNDIQVVATSLLDKLWFQLSVESTHHFYVGEHLSYQRDSCCVRSSEKATLVDQHELQSGDQDVPLDKPHDFQSGIVAVRPNTSDEERIDHGRRHRKALRVPGLPRTFVRLLDQIAG